MSTDTQKEATPPEGGSTGAAGAYLADSEEREIGEIDQPITGDSSNSTALDPFLLQALNNPRDRLMLLKLDGELERFIKNDSQERLEFPSMSSYNRLIVHRVAQYFGLEHQVQEVDSGSRRAIVLFKTPLTKLPVLRFSDLREQDEPAPAAKPVVKIMQRKGKGGRRVNLGDEEGEQAKKEPSLEEREEEYAKARARIFAASEKDTTSSTSTTPTSQPSNPAPNQGSNQWHQPHQHQQHRHMGNQQGYDQRMGNYGHGQQWNQEYWGGAQGRGAANHPQYWQAMQNHPAAMQYQFERQHMEYMGGVNAGNGDFIRMAQAQAQSQPQPQAHHFPNPQMEWGGYMGGYNPHSGAPHPPHAQGMVPQQNMQAPPPPSNESGAVDMSRPQPPAVAGSQQPNACGMGPGGMAGPSNPYPAAPWQQQQHPPHPAAWGGYPGNHPNPGFNASGGNLGNQHLNPQAYAMWMAAPYVDINEYGTQCRMPRNTQELFDPNAPTPMPNPSYNTKHNFTQRPHGEAAPESKDISTAMQRMHLQGPSQQEGSARPAGQEAEGEGALMYDYSSAAYQGNYSPPSAPVTPNHILEVCGLNEGCTRQEVDHLLEPLRKAGATVKKASGCTLLVFKTAAAAKQALDSQYSSFSLVPWSVPLLEQETASTN